jgi:hypothetical protein
VNQQQIARTVALTQLKAQRGWGIALEIGEAVVKRLEEDALSCDDANQIVVLQRKARGAREFFNQFQRDIEVEASYTPE